MLPTTTTTSTPLTLKEVLVEGRPWYLRARTVLVLVFWAVTLIGALALHVLCDVFQSHEPLFPLGPCVFAAIAFNALCAFSTAYLGTTSLEGFHFYQPFVGGQSFVVMQAFGYGIICFCETLACMYLQWVHHGMRDSATPHHVPRYGILSLLGIFPFLAHITLLSSLSFFLPPTLTPTATGVGTARRVRFAPVREGTEGLFHLWSKPPKREISLVVSFCVVTLVFSVLGAVIPRASTVSTVIFLLFQVVNVVLIHIFIGARYTPGYCWFMPVLHTWYATLIQWFLWLLQVLAVYWGVAEVAAHYRERQARSSSFRLVTLALCGVCVNVAMLLSIRLNFPASEERPPPHVGPAQRRGHDSEPGNSSSAEPTSAPSSSVQMLGRFGPVSLSCATFLHGLLVWVLSGVGDTNGSGSGRDGGGGGSCGIVDRVGEQLLAASSDVVVSDLTERVGSGLDGIRVAQTVAILFMMSFPVATHLMGRLVLGAAYHVWQPFRGSYAFVALQSLGWVSFAASWVACAAHLTSETTQASLLCAALCAFSQVMIHCSLLVFDSNDNTETTGDDDGVFTAIDRRWVGRGGSSGTGRAAHFLRTKVLRKRPVSLASAVLNGEMLVALLMMTAVIVVRVVCDVGTYHASLGATVSILAPRTISFVAVSTTALAAAATPLAHISGRDKGIAVFRPFGGSGPYVALQAVGWTAYAIAVLMCTVSAVVQLKLDRLLSDGTTDSAGSATEWSGTSVITVPFRTLNELLPVSFVLDALVWCVPLALVSLSVAVETQHTWNRVSDAEQVWDAALQLEALIASLTSDEAKRSEAFALLRKATKPTFPADVGLLAPAQRWLEAHERVRGRSGSGPLVGAGEEMADSLPHQANLKEQQAIATLIVCMTSVGTVLLFVVSAVWIAKEPLQLSAAFALAGFLLTSVTCFATHYVYGLLVHGDTAYAFFMPFTGGVSFIALQGVGWAFYSASAVLVLHALLLNQASVMTYLIAAVFSVSAQALILGSIPRFRVSPDQREKSVLERNAEGLLAALLFIASLSYAETHHMWSTTTAGGPLSSAPLIPLVVSCVTSCFAVPLTFAAVQRMFVFRTSSSSSSPSLKQGGPHEESRRAAAVEVSSAPAPVAASSDTDAQSLHHHRRRHGAPSTVAVDEPRVVQRIAQLFGMASGMVLTVLPLIVVFGTHFVVHRRAFAAMTALNVWYAATTVLAVNLAVGVLLDALGSPSSTSIAQRVKAALTTFVLYSVPTYVVVGPLSAPLLVADAIGARVFTFHALMLVLLGDVAVARFLCSAMEVSFLAVNLIRHVHEGVPSILVLLVDTCLPVFMLWYHTRYHGAPEVYGTLTSTVWTNFLRSHVFHDVEAYFRLRVIVDRDVGAPPQDSAEPRPARSSVPTWEGSPVLFSYHPHGVFPSTCLILPHTRAWQEKVRIPAERCGFPKLSIHGAGVVFRVPFLRDFVMSIGGRVVTRAAIETSLSQGNSVLIVTGGQSEMLKSRYSSKEMHLVTHHQGFLRLAVKHQVPVVPLLCFAENNVMDNIHVPWLQKKMLKLIGFPFPTVPHGRWFLPLPNRTPLTVVVGRAMNPPDGLDAKDAGGIEAFSKQYFTEVRRMFYVHRAEAGYPHMELVLHPPIC